MLVPVPLVGGMEMAVVQVIDVIAVGDSDMAAIRTVHVFVECVDDAGIHGAFVPVITVLVMQVTVVDVVHVIVVGDGSMAAIRAMHMGVTRMGAVYGVRRAGTHGLIVAERPVTCRPSRKRRRRSDFRVVPVASQGEHVGIDVRPPFGSPSDQVHDPTEIRVLAHSSRNRDDDRGARFRSHQDEYG